MSVLEWCIVGWLLNGICVFQLAVMFTTGNWKMTRSEKQAGAVIVAVPFVLAIGSMIAATDALLRGSTIEPGGRQLPTEYTGRHDN